MSSSSSGSRFGLAHCLVGGVGIGLAAAALSLPLVAQTVTPKTEPARAKPAAATTPAARPKPPVGGPTWAELTPTQQTALSPLAASWSGMTENHKRKWIALSANHGSMAPADQAKLHERMTGWASLSPQQRAQARLNFGKAQALPVEDKKAKWDAYQALSAEEKKSLADQGRQRPPGAAPAVRPVSPQKLATVPPVKAGSRHPAKIAATPAPEGAAPLIPASIESQNTLAPSQ